MTDVRWEHFPHGADMGVRGVGPTREKAFEGAALALSALVTDPRAVATKETLEIVCSAPDDEILLVDWLNAIVYEMATRQMIFGAFDVSIEAGRLRGRAGGELRDPDRHEAGVEVKGATFTELSVKKRHDGSWVAQCVVDV
jgi:tRNA nucleotidyltransferase (CCA-adding enzyme)